MRNPSNWYRGRVLGFGLKSPEKLDSRQICKRAWAQNSVVNDSNSIVCRRARFFPTNSNTYKWWGTIWLKITSKRRTKSRVENVLPQWVKYARTKIWRKVWRACPILTPVAAIFPALVVWRTWESGDDKSEGVWLFRTNQELEQPCNEKV